jgi:hypothetical protein
MKRIRMTIALAATLLVAQFATAQMMGGSGNHHGGSSGGNNGGNNGGMNGGMNGGGMNAGDMMGSMGAGMGQSLIVGSDGVLYTLRTSAASTSQAPAVDVVAIRPAGTQAWSAKVDGRMTRLELTGTLVLLATGSGDMGMDGSFEGDDDASRLVALSVASGSVQWTAALDGHVASLEPFSGGVYVLLMRHDGTNSGNGMHNGSNGTTLMKRSVAAIDNAGKVLWTIDLN